MTIAPNASNPLLEAWDSPFGLPPFDRIRPEHFAPALAEAMRQHLAELDLIGAQTEPPSFDNTVAAFDRAGSLLYRIDSVLGNLTASETSPALQAVQRETAAPLAAHDSAVKMHPAVFARVDALHRDRASLGLAPEALRLLERLHLDAVRAGARFGAEAQARYSLTMQQLATLTTRFAQNVLADEAAFQMVLDSEAELAGLPAFVAQPRQAAAERFGDGVQVITLEPFADRAVPDVLRTARPARGRLARLGGPRRERRGDGQPGAGPRNPATATGTGARARPRLLRRFRPGRYHGRQPGGSERPAR
jgi:peptidyl-dipeptidase Dcp